MSAALNTRSRLFAGAAALSLGVLALTGCASEASSSDGASSDTATSEQGWPRTFENADGTTTEIEVQPEHIVSTSVSATGTLLAIDAPVYASGSAGNGEFFAQWKDVADERGVGNLWPAGGVDLEAIYAQPEVDLIVVAANGADSAIDQVAEFNEIAPTIVVDYAGQTWQELAGELATATGLEEQAAEAVDAYDAYVADAATKIAVPEGDANVISFNGAGQDNPIARDGSAQAKVLEQLGFTVEDPNPEWHSQDNQREDFVFAAYENLTELNADTTFVLSQDNAGAAAFASDPVFANLPSVKNNQVYGLGLNSFRVDMYSATEIVDGIVENFAK